MEYINLRQIADKPRYSCDDCLDDIIDLRDALEQAISVVEELTRQLDAMRTINP